MSGQQHAPAALYRGKYPIPIVQEARWAPGPVWTGGKSRPHRDSIPDRPSRSQSLYRLSYPAHLRFMYVIEIIFRPSNGPYQVTPVCVKRAAMGALSARSSKSLATSFARFHLYAFCNVRVDLSFSHFTPSGTRFIFHTIFEAFTVTAAI